MAKQRKFKGFKAVWFGYVKEKSYDYIIKLVKRIYDIIAIITNKSGLDTQHLGFAVWHKDGLHLINASSVHHKVVEEPMLLYTYLQKRKTMTGIRIVRLSD